MIANPKFVRLLKSVLEATQSGQLSWEQTVSEEDFRVHIGGMIFRVGEHTRLDEDGEDYVTPYATLIGQGGKTLEFAEPEDLVPEDCNIIKNLYDIARRQVLRIDEILDRLIQQVESGKAR